MRSFKKCSLRCLNHRWSSLSLTRVVCRSSIDIAAFILLFDFETSDPNTSLVIISISVAFENNRLLFLLYILIR